jgi:hypothetical protein
MHLRELGHDGGELVKVERLGTFAPFLLIDAVLFFVIVWLAHLDWIVHHMLYSYGLQFSVDWAVPYWMAFRVSLALLLFGVAAVTVVGYVSLRRAVAESERTVFLCKSCGNAWVEVDRGVRVRGELPRFRILLGCPSCDKSLLDLETGAVQNDELRTREGSSIKN